MQTVTNLWDVPRIEKWDIDHDRRTIRFTSDEMDIVISVIYIGPEVWRWTVIDQESNLATISRETCRNGDEAAEDALHAAHGFFVDTED